MEVVNMSEREERRKERKYRKNLSKLVSASRIYVEDIDSDVIDDLNSRTKGKILITRLSKYVVQWFYVNPKARTLQKRQNTFYILSDGIYENPEDNEKISVVDESGNTVEVEVSTSSRRASAKIVARMLASLHLFDRKRW